LKTFVVKVQFLATSFIFVASALSYYLLLFAIFEEGDFILPGRLFML